MHKGNCRHCGKEFTAKLKSKQFCSKSCGARYRTLQVNPKQLREMTCKRCGGKYIATYTSSYCSDKCRDANRKKCGYCGKEFKGHHNAKYCSMKCKDAFKVRKDTGERKTCVICGKEYKITYMKRKTKNDVCSVTCSNNLNSIHGEFLRIEEIEELVMETDYQMSSNMVADKLNTSNTTIHSRASNKYGSYKSMVIALKGRYVNTDDSRSLTANSLFSMIEDLYNVKGDYEKEFDDLLNPLTGQRLRIDFFLKEIPLAIEYHGMQHYKPSEFFDKTNSFKARKTRDYIKASYLKEYSIPLVIFNCFDDLTEETVIERLSAYFK